MDEQTARAIAAQLRKPEGEEGIKTGEWMNRGNELMNRAVISYLDAKPGELIAEIGMGNGRFVGELLDKYPGIKYAGYDFSPIMVAESVANNQAAIHSATVTFTEADVAALPATDAAFDGIFTVNTIYFWEQPLVVMAELRRLLQPGGRLVLGFRPEAHMQRYPFVPYGFTLYTPGKVCDLLYDAGFKQMQLYCNAEPDFKVSDELLLPMENWTAVAW